MEKIKIINNKLKQIKIALFVWTLILGLAIGLGLIGYTEKNKEIKLTYLNDLIIQNDDNILKNAYLDIHTVPFVFAQYDNDNNKFYIVKDSDYLYIVYLNDDAYENISEIKDIETTPYRIEGYTEEIPDDVKKLAIDAYNEAFEEEIVTNDNFDDYFGNIYLNTNSLHKSGDIWFVFAIITAVIGISGVFIIAIYNKKSRKVIDSISASEWGKLAKEINSDKIQKYDKEKLYLTSSYIVALNSYIDIIRYKDIIWFYKSEIRTNRVKTAESLIAITKEGVKHIIVVLTNTKKQKAKFRDIYDFVKEKLPKAMIGYTKENIKKAKELYNIK